MDGQEAHILQPGESISVKASPYPVPCIKRSATLHTTEAANEKAIIKGRSDEDDWVRDINTLLQFNATFKNKHLALERAS